MVNFYMLKDLRWHKKVYDAFSEHCKSIGSNFAGIGFFWKPQKRVGIIPTLGTCSSTAWCFIFKKMFRWAVIKTLVGLYKPSYIRIIRGYKDPLNQPGFNEMSLVVFDHCSGEPAIHPLQINMEPSKNHRIEKENQLPKLQFWGSTC